jgi:hypothetical protein
MMKQVDRLPITDADWEAAWSPYDGPTYHAALEMIAPEDVVLDIGAGDLRLARRAAAHARAVIAIEQRAELLIPPYPQNLTVLCGDALSIPFPPGVTVGVLLMRNCRHFREYVSKLRAVGCRRLITNARWRMSVEQINLAQTRANAEDIRAGWYACLCGATGFIAVSAEAINPDALERVNEVTECPNCRGHGWRTFNAFEE